LVTPVIVAGNGLTVTTVVLVQPPATYDIVVVPTVSALNIPVVEMVPTAVLLLLQIPPGVASVNADVLP
jgi:hypothetical protein